MNQKTSRRRFREDPFPIKKIGSFGVFVSTRSLPIEYLQTTFLHNEIKNIKLARDLVQPANIDFDTLMQRQIDTKRALEDLKSYLSPDPEEPQVQQYNTVFFPPLLVACLLCDEDKILSRYPNETWTIEGRDTQDRRLIRRFSDYFQIQHYADKNVANKYTLKHPAKDSSEEVGLSEVQVEFKFSESREKGVKLVALDGQHRLLALQELLDQEEIKRLVVPVCIMFANHTSEECNLFHSKSEEQKLPSVSETFRKVFMDVNTGLVQVSTHFQILLKDIDVGSLVVREFCSFLTTKKEYHLCVVEWNQRIDRRANILNLFSSITSIGIIYKGLEDYFGPKANDEHLLKRLLDVVDNSVKVALDSADPDCPSSELNWSQYSLLQRDILKERVLNGIVDVLYKIFFTTIAYKEAYLNFLKIVESWEKKKNTNEDDAPDYRYAYQHLIEHNLSDLKNYKKRKGTYVEIIVKEMEKELEDSNVNQCPVKRLAVFQRSIFLSLKTLMLKFTNRNVNWIGELLVHILNFSMDFNLDLYSDQVFTTATIWDRGSVRAKRQMTVTQFSRLTLAVCGHEETSRHIVGSIMDVDEYDFEIVCDTLTDLGKKESIDYWSQYVDDRIVRFGEDYREELGISEQKVKDLESAKEKGKEEFRLEIRKFLENDLIRSGTKFSEKLNHSHFLETTSSRVSDDDDEA